MKASIGKLWMLLVLGVIICSVATEGRRSPVKGCRRCRTKVHNPVCASNGKTYASKCKFLYAKCVARRNFVKLTIRPKGECKDEDANAKVSEDAVKYEAEDVDSTLFGDDNNSAQLMKSILYNTEKFDDDKDTEGKKRENDDVEEAEDDEKEDDDATEGRRSPVKGCKRCRTKIYQPVCVSNGQTWQKCPFQFAKCAGHRNFVKLTIRHEGECKGTREYDDVKEAEDDEKEDDDVEEPEDEEKEDDDVEEAEDDEKEDDDVEEPEDEEEDDGEGDFNPDSFELEAEGIPVEVVREETKIIRAIEGGECNEENPKACCQYCDICGTCKEKCGDSAEVPFSAARTPHLRFCAICSRCSLCKTICANL